MSIDDDDKARRNLVVFCAAVLAGTWLGLQPLAALRTLLGETPAADVSLARAWTLVLAVLCYLLIRYHFSTECREARDQYRSLVESRGHGLGLYLAELLARRAVRTGKRAPLSNTDIPAAINKMRSDFGFLADFNGRVDMVNGTAQWKHPWELRLSPVIEFRSNDGKRAGSHDGLVIVFEWPTRAARWPILAAAHLSACVWSPWMPRGAPPIVLSLALLVVALTKLWQLVA